MRSIPFIVAAFLASGPAAAQNWEEYDYPKYAFAVSSRPSRRSKRQRIKWPMTAWFRRRSIRSVKAMSFSR